MKESIDQPKDGPPSSSYVVHLLGRSGDNVGYLRVGSHRVCHVRTACFPEKFQPGMLYQLSWSTSNHAIFADLYDAPKAAYLNRHTTTFTDVGYEWAVLRSLLLERRIDDFNDRCATVRYVSPDFLFLSMAQYPDLDGPARFQTEFGVMIDVIVESVRKHREGVVLYCTPLQDLPGGLCKNSRLDCVSQDYRTPMVTEILEDYAAGYQEIMDRQLLQRLYGKEGAYSQHKVNESLVRLHAIDGRSQLLPPDQSEAVRRYVDEVSGCPGFVLEGAPRTGSALTLAAMCSTYCLPDGLQLILGPDRDSLRDIEIELNTLDLGGKRIVNIAGPHPVSSNFSFYRAGLNKKQLAHMERIARRLARASGRTARTLRRLQRSAHAAAIAALGPQDVIMATVEQAFYWLRSARPCPIQEQLRRSVTRIIIQDSDALSEAELNALVLLYARPGTKIVSVANDGQSVLHQEGCCALELMKRKKNLPVIKLRDSFLENCWEDVEEEEELTLDLGEILKDAVEARERAEWDEKWKADCNRAFISVTGSRPIPSGKSYISDEEIAALTWFVERLRGAGYDHRQVLILAFSEAQRRLAMTRLPADYTVAMVDEAEDIEGKIAIVMTTGDASSAARDVACKKRWSIALSAHTDALIVLGSDDQGTTSGWKHLLQRGVFNTMKFSLE